MILVDTSVWIDHIRKPDPQLLELLGHDDVWMHPYVIGEIAVGSIAKRSEILSMLKGLRILESAADQEVLTFIEENALFSVGIGYIDAHLLAAVRLAPGTTLWTRDNRLGLAATRLGCATFEPKPIH